METERRDKELSVPVSLFPSGARESALNVQSVRCVEIFFFSDSFLPKAASWNYWALVVCCQVSLWLSLSHTWKDEGTDHWVPESYSPLHQNISLDPFPKLPPPSPPVAVPACSLPPPLPVDSPTAASGILGQTGIRSCASWGLPWQSSG